MLVGNTRLQLHSKRSSNEAHTVQGCISKANKNLEKLRQQIVDMEDVDNEESGSSGAASDEEESDIGDSDTED